MVVDSITLKVGLVLVKIFGNFISSKLVVNLFFLLEQLALCSPNPCPHDFRFLHFPGTKLVA